MSSAAASADHPAVGELVHGLDPAQAAAVLADAPVVVVLAGAGSGKTRVLTRRIVRRIADGSAEARHVLALTFTRKAAGELRHRLAGLGGHHPTAPSSPAVHTFHALGGALLQRWWLDRGERPWGVTRDRPALLARALDEAGVADLGPPALGDEIGWGRARLLDPTTYAAAAAGRGTDAAAVAAGWQAYEDEKRRRRLLDVDDLITEPVRLLSAEPAFAGARTWWHRHLFVDEGQDLNPAQLRLLTLLAGPQPDLCVVGDPDQAIYGWNGSDPHLLTDLAGRLPPGAVHRLAVNHRCTAPIARAAASILGEPTAPVAGDRDGGRWPLPTVTGHADEVAEADAVAHRLQEARWRGGRAWSSMAVLVRTRAQLDVVAAALAARGIPHRLPGSLLDRPEVIAALRALRASDDGRRRPLRELAGDLPELTAALLLDPAGTGPGAGPGPAQAAGPPTGRAGRGPVPDDPGPAVDDPVVELRRAHLEALAELVDEFCQAVPAGDLDAFRSWSRGVLGARGGDQGFDRRGVTLTTFHRAKGLEWEVVVVAGCEDGLVPHRRSATVEARAEERRLAYVAATRASEELHLTWAAQRATPWGVRAASRSPFLADLEREVAPPVDGATIRAGRAAGLRAARAALVPRPVGLRAVPRPTGAAGDEEGGGPAGSAGAHLHGLGGGGEGAQRR
jgi:DNA helicase-2/ATP-dependent DNA helicase PcrA